MKHNLFLGQRSIEDLKADCQSTHRLQYQRLLKQAQSYINWLPPAEHPSKSITYIGMAAANLALAYRLSGQVEFLESLRKWLNAAVAYPHWGKERMPDHDLDAAWLLFGLSLAYEWVGQDLPSGELSALRDKLLLQGQRLYDFALETEGQWWSSAYWQNHNWICYAGLAAAAYALQDKYTDAQQWSRKALENFKIVFSAMPEDGSDYEGVVYWCYGVPWMMIYADLAAQQEQIDFYSTPFLQNTFYYRLYMSGPNLVDTANFGDCHDRRSAHSRAMYYWFARHHRNSYAQWLAEHFEQSGEWEREARAGLLMPGMKTQAFLDLLWYDPTVESQPVACLPLSRTFPDLGLTSARTSWETDATFLAFKSSVPLGLKAWAAAQDLINTQKWDATSGGHLHPDENSFILVRGADYLAVDEGYSKAKQTIQHNTVLVDGCGQYREGEFNVAEGLNAGWGARLQTVFAAEGMLYARGEAAGAYPPEIGLRRFQRQIVLWDAGLVLICDDLAARQPRQFEWLLQTDREVDLGNFPRFTLITGETRLNVDFVAPAELDAKTFVQEVVAVPSSAQPGDVLRRLQHTLAVSPKIRRESCQFLAVLTMENAIAGSPVPPERLDCFDGQGLRITYPGRQVVAGFASTARYWGAENLFGTDAPWFAAESDPQDRITKLAVGDSTRTYIKGQLWCAASSPASFLYQPGGWTVQSASPAWVSLRLPPGAAIHLNGTLLDKNTGSPITRLEVPGGESNILFG